jgi:hypothetical protein
VVRTITRGSAHYFRTVTSVAHFRVIASEAAFGVNYLAETLRCAQHLTKLFMFLYQKGVRSQKCSHQVALSAVHWHHHTSHCHQPPRPLFPECHHLPVRRFQSVTSGAPYVPQRSLQYLHQSRQQPSHLPSQTKTRRQRAVSASAYLYELTPKNGSYTAG